MMTIQEAIDYSVTHNDIVVMDYDQQTQAELMVRCEGYAHSDTAQEFWGVNNGCEWRVHMRVVCEGPR